MIGSRLQWWRGDVKEGLHGLWVKAPDPWLTTENEQNRRLRRSTYQ